MKRILLNITFASVFTLIAYIALYAVWGAILNEFENSTLRLFLIAVMTTIAFGFILLYISKIRKSVGENEIISDYTDKMYISAVDDFKLIIKREYKMLISIAIIVLICFALNSFDKLMFEKKVISFPTFFFVPMYIFDSLINVPFVGYVLSILFDSIAYIVFLLIYRKKKYDYWMR
ncbi:MAG: hypothetical protein E7633_08510 [Ruminococcaceae bacterium]|nr:hypothetical protein [Oscillospiraceae bacterium]